MRRKDREIRDREELLRMMERCDVCRLALHDQPYPYILPLNFGLRVEDGVPVLYFHGAQSGKKFELMERDARAGFEMDCAHELVADEEQGMCTMNYESVIGGGRLEEVEEAKKEEALELLMRHYHLGAFPFDRSAVPGTRVFRLVVEQLSGKRRAKK